MGKLFNKLDSPEVPMTKQHTSSSTGLLKHNYTFWAKVALRRFKLSVLSTMRWCVLTGGRSATLSVYRSANAFYRGDAPLGRMILYDVDVQGQAKTGLHLRSKTINLGQHWTLYFKEMDMASKLMQWIHISMWQWRCNVMEKMHRSHDNTLLKMYDRANQKTYTARHIKQDNYLAEIESLEKIQRVYRLRKYIVPIQYFFENDDGIVTIVQPFCHGRNLQDKIEDTVDGYLTETSAKYVFHRLLCVAAYCEENGLNHSAISSTSILFGSETDFSRPMINPWALCIKSPQNNDIHLLSVILKHMLTGEQASSIGSIHEFRRSSATFSNISLSISAAAQDLQHQLEDVKSPIAIQDVLNHPWLV